MVVRLKDWPGDQGVNRRRSGVARAPQAPRPRGARGAEGTRQGPARKT